MKKSFLSSLLLGVFFVTSIGMLTSLKTMMMTLVPILMPLPSYKSR